MSSKSTTHIPDHQPRIVVALNHDGMLYAGYTVGVGVDRHEAGVYGTPEDVVAFLHGLSRAATDAAVASLNPEPPVYTPTFPVVDGVEFHTRRFACCGAGPDRVATTGERLHFDGCARVRFYGVDDITPADIQAEQADAGRYDPKVA